MIKFTSLISSLLILAAPNSCLSGNETPASSGASTSSVDVNALTLPEKIKHFEALTTIVESLAGGIGLGDNCLAHHLYLVGPMGVSKKQADTFAAQTIKEANYTEPVVSGLVAVAKADVYVLKQIVDTSKVVLEGLNALAPAEPATPAAAGASMTFAGEGAAQTEAAVPASAPSLTPEQTTKITELRGKIQTVIKKHVKDAMSTLPVVEETIYGFAGGNKDSDGGFHTAIEATAKTALSQQIAKLAKDTSSMIGGYFTLLAEAGVTDSNTAAALTGLKKLKANDQAKSNYGETEEITEASNKGAFFAKADAYQKAFVAYIAAAVTGENVDALKLKTEVNAVAAQVAATGDTNGGKEAKALDTVRKAYVEEINEKITDIAAENGPNAVICGRKKLTEVMLGIVKGSS